MGGDGVKKRMGKVDSDSDPDPDSDPDFDCDLDFDEGGDRGIMKTISPKTDSPPVLSIS